MPLFEYQCSACGHRFEALVIGTRQPDKCPRCAAQTIEKQVSTFGVGGTNGGYGTSSRLGSSSCGPGGG
jgi:putative FmdB family regulatory protein